MNSRLYMRYTVAMTLCLSAQLHGMKLLELVLDFPRNAIRKVDATFWPNYTRVFANDAQKIELAPHENVTKTIETNKLIGCAATVTYAKDQDNHKTILLTHYAPRLQEYHVEDLKHHLKEMTHNKKLQHLAFVVVLPNIPENRHYDEHAAQCKDLLCTEEGCVLKQAVKDGSDNHPISMHHAYYDLPPTGKAYFDASVVVKLSNERSYCKVCDCYMWKNKALNLE